MIELHLRARQIVAAHEDAVSNAWWQGLLFGVSLLLGLAGLGWMIGACLLSEPETENMRMPGLGDDHSPGG